jgi:hypothetical protein
MRNRGLGFSWFALLAVGVVGAIAGQVTLVAMASLAGALLAAITYSVFSQRRMREVMPGTGYHLFLGLVGLAVVFALLGTFAATKTVIADSDGRDHSLSYGIVCGITLIFGYRTVIKRTPRSVAVLALFTHVLGFIVVVYNFFGTQSTESEEIWDTLVIRFTPAALAMFGLLASTAVASALALLHFIPAREDDELADVPEAHVIE